jgi:PKD repeat protein
MTRKTRIFECGIPKSQSGTHPCAVRFAPFLNVSGILLLFSFVFFISPSPLFAIGEYDGLWVGPVTVTVSALGEQETVTTGSLVYQEDVETLALYDDLFNVFRLKKSGNQWILPSPLQTTWWGMPATVADFRLTFQSTSYATGTATVNVTVQGAVYTGNAAYSVYKQSCTVLTNGTTLSALSGAEGSYTCYQIEIPAGSTNFNVLTSGGTGDCDLAVGYYRPEFDFTFSEGDYTQEQIQVASPRSGLWYIMLTGYTSFSGVNLSVSFQTVPALSADFEADLVSGMVPLNVRFTDLSTGIVTGRTWDFGDGSGSSDQNPTHIYSKPGIYTVSLTVTGPGGTDTEIKSNYVKVEPKKSTPWLPLLLDD